MCDQFWNWIYSLTDAWERANSNAVQLWSEQSEDALALVSKAHAIEADDPAAAFQFYREAADAGSVWAMEAVGWHYAVGSGTEANAIIAGDYYRRAAAAGSLMSIVNYARVLKNNGCRVECEHILEEGIAKRFVPASFWLALYRFNWEPTAATCKAVRPMLESAAKCGHPFARITLARWQAFGKLGILEIARGIRSSVALIGALVGHDGDTDKGLAALAKLQNKKDPAG